MARSSLALLVLLFSLYRKYSELTEKHAPVPAKYIKGGGTLEKTTKVDKRLPSTWTYAKLGGPRTRPYPKPDIAVRMDAFIYRHGDLRLFTRSP